MYHVLANPAVNVEVVGELEAAIPDPSSPRVSQDIEHLPYLGAVNWEGMRLSYGSIHRLQRIHPDTDLTFYGWTIPAGTPVGLSSTVFCNDPEFFPTPRELTLRVG